MGKKNYYAIVPMNEGQDLNYIEDFKGNLSEAKARAYVMKHHLKKALIRGIVSIRVEDKEGKIKEVI